MYSPEPSSRNLSSNLMYSTNNSGFKHGLTDGVLFKNKEILNTSSDLFQNNHQQQGGGGGLMRYRSAPSSYFASLLEGHGNNSNNNSNGDSSESESMFSALMNCHEPTSNNLKNHGGFGGSGAGKMEISEVESNPQNGNGFVSGGENGMVQMGGYLAAVNAGGGAVVGSYSLPIDGGVENHFPARNCSNLVRQSSSPAGFFSGFDMMHEVGNLRGGTNGDASSSTSGLNSGINFMSPPSSSSRFMPSIAENVTESARTGSPENAQFGTGTDNGSRGYNSHFPREPWAGNDNGSSSFTNLKRNRDGDMKLFSSFSGVENQGIEPRNRPSGLTHHLSLPKTAVEMAAVETYLQFQPDSIPCKIRAKRGCATHPRSIAERMRRTRISERMKKLQELFPNMDKQANTADMLDLAVDHIKNLQKQVQTLKETRAKCTCSSKQQQTACPSD